MTNGDAYRNKLVQLIHVAKKDLGLDDDAYRAVLREQTGAETTSHLGIKGLEKVLDHMQARGFVIRAKPRGKAAPLKREVISDDDEQIRKIRSLWLELRDMGVLRDSSEAALNNYCKRITGIARLDWVPTTTRLTQVIETMKQWIAREEKIIQEAEIISTWEALAAKGRVTAGREALDKFIQDGLSLLHPEASLKWMRRAGVGHTHILLKLQEVRDG